jgi:glycosyltransferase involved in cell wall biosynthesis
LDGDGSAALGEDGRGVAVTEKRSNGAPLRVCFFSHSSDLAGAERTLLELVTQLIEDHGTLCTVVVPGDGPLISRLERSGACVIRTAYSWWCDIEPVPGDEAGRRMAESVARLRDQILPSVEAFGPDVICTQTIVIPYGAMAATALHKPHIWNLREYGEAGGFHFFKPFKEVADFIREKSDFVFGANRGLCRQLIPDLEPEKHDFLYPVLDTPPFVSVAGRGLKTPGAGRFRLVEFATISPAKRLDVAINAVGSLVRRGRSVELLIAGSQVPAYVVQLQEMIRLLDLQDRVEIRVFMNDVYSEMAAADAVVISAPVHSFGRTAGEAMSVATPVVYPLGTGFDDYLEDGVTGLGYPAGDPEAMAERIDMLIQYPRFARNLGLTAQIVAGATFTRDAFGGKFYRRALALRNRHRGR